MYFKLEYAVRDFYLQLNGSASLQFDYDGPHGVIVKVRGPTEDEQESGYKAEDALTTTTSQQDASDYVRGMFESLSRNELPAGSMSLEVWNQSRILKSDFLDENGHIKENHGVPLSIMPQPFVSFVDQVVKELTDYTKQTIKVLRWRLAGRGRHNPFNFRRFEWSFDSQVWKLLPVKGELYLDDFAWLRVPERIHDEVVGLVRGGITEPLGHELFREAWEQRMENPRSALILGIAAAEIGLKQCVGILVPGAQWLVDELPSPPLVKMLQEYLPKLPAKLTIGGEVRPPPSTIIQLLKKGVNLRNQIIHGRAATLENETLKDILVAVHDLLWILDYYCGFQWALSNVSPGVRDLL